MALQVSRAGSEYGSMRGAGRPVSHYEAGSGVGPVSTRVRSKSVAEARQYTKDGRPILHHGKFRYVALHKSSSANIFTARAMYMYTAQIPEELGFGKGDILAVLRLQDDGWWESEIVGRPRERGLVPSNYLQVIDG